MVIIIIIIETLLTNVLQISGIESVDNDDVRWCWAWEDVISEQAGLGDWTAWAMNRKQQGKASPVLKGATRASPSALQGTRASHELPGEVPSVLHATRAQLELPGQVPSVVQATRAGLM